MNEEDAEMCFIGGFRAESFKILASKLESDQIDFRPRVAAQDLRDISALRLKAKTIEAEIQPLVGSKAGNPGNPKRMTLRQDAIMVWMGSNSVDPLKFTKNPGRGGGDKGRCRSAMLDKPSTFPNESAFDNTWEALRKNGLIEYKD